MKAFKHWMVALDLTSMDDFLVGYVNFLAGELEPEQITFLHILEKSAVSPDMADLFPDIEEPDKIIGILKDEIVQKVSEYFTAGTEWSTAILSGESTDSIIRAMQEYDPDLLVLGKKTGYEGEGVIAKKIVRYIPCSVIFIPETSNYKLDNLLIPINFNKHSARALQFGIEFANTCGATVTAQHVYQYPPQFFPGIPVDEFRDKMKEPLEENLAKFKKDYSLPEDIDYIFTLNKNKKVPDMIYDQSVKDNTDMILVGARNRPTLAKVLMDDLADRMIHYNFGIPLFIFKDKREYKSLIESFLTG